MKTNFDKKPLTWEDIEDNLKNSSSTPADDDKLEYFRSIIIDHLDNLQKEEDKKIIPFPKK